MKTISAKAEEVAHDGVHLQCAVRLAAEITGLPRNALYEAALGLKAPPATAP